jgi:hypothetical protein
MEISISSKDFFRGDELLANSRLGNQVYCRQHGYIHPTEMLDAGTGDRFIGCSICVLQICNSSRHAGPFAVVEDDSQ